MISESDVIAVYFTQTFDHCSGSEQSVQFGHLARNPGRTVSANSMHWFTTSFLQGVTEVPESDARSVQLVVISLLWAQWVS